MDFYFFKGASKMKLSSVIPVRPSALKSAKTKAVNLAAVLIIPVIPVVTMLVAPSEGDKFVDTYQKDADVNGSCTGKKLELSPTNTVTFECSDGRVITYDPSTSSKIIKVPSSNLK